ncbi:MAG: response regulator transcription factor [Candidatus Acidiferrum sp.]|jgi:two-component system KDP operon response regulator KdpE
MMNEVIDWGQSISTGARPSNGRILVVDDHPQIRRVLRTALVANSYEVDDARDGDEALNKVYEERYDVILLDCNMPGMLGMEVCRAVRAFSDAGIIMLTVRNSELDKVRALDSGANDYVTKPFSTPELLARIRALLRRNASERSVERLKLGHVEVDFETRHVAVRGTRVHLTPKEFKFLQYLADRPNRIVSHRELLRAVWGPEYGEELDYVRTLVKQLRKKIEAQPAQPQHVLTHPWVGYELRVL